MIRLQTRENFVTLFCRRTDAKAYYCKTATVSFIYLLIVLMISKILNINMPQEFILISASQRNPIYCDNLYNIRLLKVYAKCMNDLTGAKVLIGERIL
jgi:hypothetical protein